MKRRPVPTAPRKPKVPKVAGDPMAALLTKTLQQAHGHDQAALMRLADEMGRPRGFVGTRNIALDRALGVPGIPLGRLTEISGWEGSGKSTALDQILAQVQADGGIGMLADVERARDRDYMVRLGVDPDSTLWALGRTVEQLFDHVSTFARTIADQNTVAWVAAMRRAGIRVPDPPSYRYDTFDPTQTGPNRRPIATFRFHAWGREQAALLLQWQIDNGITPSGTRDSKSRAILRPVVLLGEEDERLEALEYWERGDDHPFAITADRPVVIGWDSIAGTATEKEMEGDARQEHVAVAAKVIKRNFRRLITRLDDEAIALVVVNQRYEVIETTYIPGGRRGKRSETYGGGAIKYHSTVRVELERVGGLWSSPTAKANREPPMGQITRIKVPKNKVASPNRTEEYGLVYGRGADNAWALYENLKSREVIRGGNWSKFTDPSIMGGEPGGDKSWQGTWMGLSDLMAHPDYPTLWPRLRQIYMDGSD